MPAVNDNETFSEEIVSVCYAGGARGVFVQRI